MPHIEQTRSDYVENLKDICDSIKANADSIIGNIENVSTIEVIITFQAGEITNYEVRKRVIALLGVSMYGQGIR